MDKFGNRWRKAKLALGLKLCVYVPRSLGDNDATASPSDEHASRMSSDANAPDSRATMPITPTPTFFGLRLSKSGSRSSKRTCAICLEMMKPGHGQALFTAECSHTFHFHCIASNVKHGNHLCPVCRAKWKEIPFQSPATSESNHGRVVVNTVNRLQDDGHMNIVRRIHRTNSSHRLQHPVPLFHSSEPTLFNDDEPLDSLSEVAEDCMHRCVKTVEIKTYPEFSAIPQSVSEKNFTVLLHLKAPLVPRIQNAGKNIPGSTDVLKNTRAPVDLVTVLDVSGSMAGTKLALLKRAMGFVIQNLGPYDRISVISFSSTARRLFPLRRMSESGRQEAIQLVNSLTSSGGTNIVEGLRKGAKVIEERTEKNPVCSIILLSDGQDTYTLIPTTGVGHPTQPDYRSLLPASIRGDTGCKVPVHVFGFGADHDSVSMHSISECSGGTFSFIEAEGAIQDAFAQCIGGLLSVVVQEMRLALECVHPNVHLGSIKSGSYASHVADDGRSGSVVVGDLYADEERDFLISINVPPACEETALLEVRCVYREPIMKEIVILEAVEVKVSRPVTVVAQTVSIEVDRQRNRLQAADAMAKARAAAERGELSAAVSVLEESRKKLLQSLAGQLGDRLCMTLDSELKEMEERMANRQRYEESGRAYVLSGLSSHSWQRATTRGNSTESGDLLQAYQTPSMVDMLQRSQTLCPARCHPNPQIQHVKSLPARVKPR